MKCSYSCSLHMLGHTTVFIMPGCRLKFPVSWLITSQASPDGRTRGSVFLGAGLEVLIVATWFSMRSCPWIQHDIVFFFVFFWHSWIPLCVFVS